MKRTLALLTMLAIGGLSAPTYADSNRVSNFFKVWGCNFFDCGTSHWHKHNHQPKPKPGHPHHHHDHKPKPGAPAPAPKPSVASAPEIDAGQAGLALALLGSIVAITREKYRPRSR